MKRVLGFALGLVAAGGCAGDGTDGIGGRGAPTGQSQLALDNVDVPATGVSLLTLGPGADQDHLLRVITEQLQGTAYLALAPRMVTASVPAGADAVLKQLGVTAKYDRAVDPSEIAGASVEESRFVRVFDNRYFPSTTSAALRTAPQKLVQPKGAPFELPPVPPPPRTKGAPSAPIAPGEPPPSGVLDRVAVPFASGTVVVSVILPESNGAIDPSTEDWTEEAVVETYQKIQSALEAISRSDPLSGIRFVMHYESKPADGALPGTVDCDYEFGKSSAWGGSGEPAAQANVLSRVLGRTVPVEGYWDAELEYLANLKARYHATGGYIVFVAADGNGTAALRAHATIGGPWTTLSSDYGYETFMHEFGHIFGALDEYCPDSCTPPNALGGYLDMVNANATYMLGGPGINDGQGEDQNSLMSGNSTNAVNGYTRGEWGWLDTDGDGIVEVRDTFPKSSLSATVSGTRVHLTGHVIDVPMTNSGWFDGPRSANRIDALAYRVASLAGAPWISVPIIDSGTSRADVDIDLGNFPPGNHRVEFRAVNSVGNVEPLANSVQVTVTGSSLTAHLPPRIMLTAAPRVGSPRSPFTLSATTFDFNANDVVTVRWDTNGDGIFDTPFMTSPSTSARFTKPGIYQVLAEARDRAGMRTQASTTVYVLDGNAEPTVTIGGGASPIFGSSLQNTTLRVGSYSDPDGDAVQFNWIAESALLYDDPFRVETGFSPDNDTFSLSLRTPIGLRYHTVDLSAGDPALTNSWGVSEVVQIAPNLLAVADGTAGLLISDVTDQQKPQLVARLMLETGANQLSLSGTRLYVLGSLLTVVDVSNPRKPFEILQRRPVTQTHILEASDVSPINDGSDKGAAEFFFANFGEKIASISISVVVDHSAPGELRFYLHQGGDGTSTDIILRDQQPGPAGLQTYTFDETNAPGLAQLLGKAPSGLWDLRVADVVAGGGTGSLNSATITISTTARAVPVLPEANNIVGVLGSRYVVVRGQGVQVLDAQSPDNIREASRFVAGSSMDGTLVGSTAYMLAFDGTKPVTGAAVASTPLVGFYALDLSDPRHPWLRRADSSNQALSVDSIGSRLYLTTYPAKGAAGQVTVSIVDPRAFTSGGRYIVGAFAGSMNSGFGDDRAIWITDGGKIEHWNVLNPRAPRLLGSYARPITGTIIPLNSSQAIAYEGGISVKIVNLGDEVSTESRTFRVTLEARDARGAVSRDYRTVHMIPYDHAPSLDTVTFSQGKPGAVASFVLSPSDPDSTAGQWDSTWLVRADFDGDGIYESPWSYVTARQPATLENQYATAGQRHVRFQLRDSFFATSEIALDVDVK